MTPRVTHASSFPLLTDRGSPVEMAFTSQLCFFSICGDHRNSNSPCLKKSYLKIFILYWSIVVCCSPWVPESQTWLGNWIITTKDLKRPIYSLFCTSFFWYTFSVHPSVEHSDLQVLAPSTASNVHLCYVLLELHLTAAPESGIRQKAEEIVAFCTPLFTWGSHYWL